MSERWFHERTDDGWEIRDENRLLVALVPDVQHEREADADVIARAHGNARLAQATDLIRSNLGNEIEALRSRVIGLVASTEADARALAQLCASEGPDAAAPIWLSMHVNALVEAHADLAEKRRRLVELENVLSFARNSEVRS